MARNSVVKLKGTEQGGTPRLPAAVANGSGARPTLLRRYEMEFAMELDHARQGIDRFSGLGPMVSDSGQHNQA